MKPILRLLLFCCACGAVLGAASPMRSSVFKMCLAFDRAGPGTVPMTVTTRRGGQQVVHVQKTALLDHTAIRSAKVKASFDPAHPVIDIIFTDQGKARFAEVTRQNIGKRLAIIVDGKLLAAPVVNEAVTGGHAQITGTFTAAEAEDLAAKINKAAAR